MILREEHEKIEKGNLASYAQKSSESKGRCFPEAKHPYRTDFQRDRDRIVHSTAFRRLQYKTQVFINHEGDHYRTRLTHTMEVSIIARSIARTLRLNEDLTEAIALAHDIGHTPFGHSGEEALNEILKDNGGFEHNRQCIRVVDFLERRYPNHPGLNLTYELREGILKHESEYDSPDIPEDLKNRLGPSLECQIVNMSDEIAYNCHDIDDGVTSGVLNIDKLKSIQLCAKHIDLLNKKYLALDSGALRRILIRELINDLVTDLVTHSSENLKDVENYTASDIREKNIKLLSFSQNMKEDNKELKRFLRKNLYRHPRMIKNAQRAKEIISFLFDKYMNNLNLLQEHIRKRMESEPIHVVIADYIAGMTDRFAQLEYNKLNKKAH